MVRKSLLCLAIIGLVPFVLSQQNEEGASVENSIPPVCEYRPNGKKHIT
ncbi:unnamed protein product, partial [Allacma fusca]